MLKTVVGRPKDRVEGFSWWGEPKVEKENIKESAAQTKKQEPCKEVLHKGYGRIQPKKNPTGFRD